MLGKASSGGQGSMNTEGEATFASTSAERKRNTAEERGEFYGRYAAQGTSSSAASASETGGAGLMAALSDLSTESSVVEWRKRPPQEPRIRRPLRP